MNDKYFEYVAKNTTFVCESCDFTHPIKVFTELNYIPVKNTKGIFYLPENVLADVAEMIGYHAVNIRPQLNGFSGYDCLQFEISKEPFMETNTETDYVKYRGKCKEMSEQACLLDSSLTLVRGYYYCPVWNVEDQHWWTVKPDGTIYDPTAKQYPSAGIGVYTPFNGMVSCSNCGKELKEEDASFDSNYCFCSNRCYGIFVGVY